MLTIYKDINANAIFIEDANGVQFLNSLQASANGDNVTVLDLARDIEIVTETHYSQFEDQAGASYGSDAEMVCLPSYSSLQTFFASTIPRPAGKAVRRDPTRLYPRRARTITVSFRSARGHGVTLGPEIVRPPLS